MQKDNLINIQNHRINVLEEKIKRLLVSNSYYIKKYNMLLKNIHSKITDIENKIRIVIDNTLSRYSVCNQKKHKK